MAYVCDFAIVWSNININLLIGNKLQSRRVQKKRIPSAERRDSLNMSERYLSGFSFRSYFLTFSHLFDGRRIVFSSGFKLLHD